VTRTAPRALLGLLCLALLPGCRDEDTNLPFSVPATPNPPIVTGPTPIFFDLIGPSGTSALVAVQYTTDRGQTFVDATPAPGSPSQAQVAAAPDGFEQFFLWDPLSDLGPGVHRDVRIRVWGFGKDAGLFGDTGPLTVDLTDRLDPAPSGGLAVRDPITAPLPDGSVWVAGGTVAGTAQAGAVRYDPVADEFTPTTGLQARRARRGAALLGGGDVLVAGGFDDGGDPRDDAETFRLGSGPGAGATAIAGGLAVARGGPAIGALGDGRGVVVGGATQDTGTASTPVVEVFTPDPAGGGSFQSALSSPLAARTDATATSLVDGGVVVIGGFDAAGDPVEPTARIDAAVAAVTTAADLLQPRGEHAAVRLPDGRVLVVGGAIRPGDDQSAIRTTEVYDPETDAFSILSDMGEPRRAPAAVYAGGFVVVFGGRNGGGASATAERYDLEEDRWEPIASPSATPRDGARAVATGPGRALLVGGEEPPELYTPDAFLGAEAFEAVEDVPAPRAGHAATLLADGGVLLTGGTSGVTSAVASVERFDPDDDVFEPRADLLQPRTGHAAAPVGFGEVIVVGGADAAGLLAEVERYDPVDDSWQVVASLGTPRLRPTATLLDDGTVLIAGGVDAAGDPVALLERYDPVAGTISPAGSLDDARADHDALGYLSRAILAGGRDASGPLDGLETVEAVNLNRFAVTLAAARSGPGLAPLTGTTAFVVTGGEDAAGPRADLEVLDLSPGPGPTLLAGQADLARARAFHRAVGLVSGEVLLVGGRGATGGLVAQGEVFSAAGEVDLTDGTTTTTADSRVVVPRVEHTATPLGDGRVLVVGGRDERGVVVAGAEVFLP